MKSNPFLKSATPHIAAALVFLIILFIYFFPYIDVFHPGKSLIQSDITQITGSLKEANDYQSKTGEEILWSNSGFAGMPVWRGYGNNALNYFHYFTNAILPNPVLLCFIAFIGFYILLKSFKVNDWLSFAGAAAYTFSSFTLISIEAGHINKVYDMALMSPVLAGIVMTYQGRYWLGSAVTALFLSLQIYYGHVQITYYLFILVLFFVIAHFIVSIKTKTVPAFFKASILLVFVAVLSVAPNVSKLWTMSEYVKSTTRGGSELSTQQTEGGGLDKDYAFQWSNGKMETMTIFIPYFYGGSSHEELGKSSNVYKQLAAKGYAQEAKNITKSIPLYWGDQPFTSGPVYFGAIICFLFVLGLFLVKDNTKWWILGATILSIMLSWGKNIEWFTDIFFNYVPLYNKFRSVTMTLSIAQVTVPLLGFLALRNILNGTVSKAEVLDALKKSTMITGGIALFFALFGSAFFDFTSENDAQLSQFPKWLMEAIESDRASKLRWDSLRSLFFVAAAAGLIWASVKEKITLRNFYLALSFLILIDLTMVDKRYLNNDDFKVKKNYDKEVFAKTSADETILQDQDPDFRVLNFTKGITSDAVTSYYHKSLGGYSAIKLRRYQDLIDSAISKNNMAVINMLNTKYFIVGDKETGAEMAQRNPGALGNAWFVSNFKFVKNADEEINAIKNFDPSTTALVDEKFKEQLQGKSFSKDPSDKIELVSYHPNRLSYKYKASNESLAVFSEVYYQPGWNAYIDGKPSPHFRANYILRAMVLPAGKHTIDFKFEPKSYEMGEKISLAGSAFLIIFLLLVFAKEILTYYKNQKNTQ
jgi:hypothetical protein